MPDYSPDFTGDVRFVSSNGNAALVTQTAEGSTYPDGYRIIKGDGVADLNRGDTISYSYSDDPAVEDKTIIISGIVVAPSFAPGDGYSGVAVDVTISTTTEGATIRYTDDGSEPTTTTGTIYTGPVNVAASATLKAIAYKEEWTPSAVTEATYTIV